MTTENDKDEGTLEGEHFAESEDILGYVKRGATQLRICTDQQLAVLDLQKGTNLLLAKQNSRISIVIAVASLGLVAVFILSLLYWQSTKQLTSSWNELITLKGKLDENIAATKRVEQSSKETKEDIAAVDQKVQDSPKVAVDEKTGEFKLEVPVKKKVVVPLPTPPAPSSSVPIMIPDGGEKAIINLPKPKGVEF